MDSPEKRRHSGIAILSALSIGLLFGFGLIVSQMNNPAKVLNFLDLAGRWDPSLILVMAGAVAVGSAGFALARRRGLSLLGQPLALPTASAIDRRLVLGSLAFGAGWGLAGFCPGPALASLALGGSAGNKALLFCGAMLAGMLIFEVIERWRKMRAMPPISLDHHL